jgi:hypothetical protein
MVASEPANGVDDEMSGAKEARNNFCGGGAKSIGRKRIPIAAIANLSPGCGARDQ